MKTTHWTLVLLLLACAAFAQSQKETAASTSARSNLSENRSVVQSTGAPKASGPYSQAIKAGELVFCAGQLPLDPATGRSGGCLCSLLVQE
jgi:hypothetical protein